MLISSAWHVQDTCKTGAVQALMSCSICAYVPYPACPAEGNSNCSFVIIQQMLIKSTGKPLCFLSRKGHIQQETFPLSLDALSCTFPATHFCMYSILQKSNGRKSKSFVPIVKQQYFNQEPILYCVTSNNHILPMTELMYTLPLFSRYLYIHLRNYCLKFTCMSIDLFTIVIVYVSFIR